VDRYSLKSAIMLQASLRSDDELFIDPEKPLAAAPEVVGQQASMNVQWQVGLRRGELHVQKQDKLVVKLTIQKAPSMMSRATYAITGRQRSFAMPSCFGIILRFTRYRRQSWFGKNWRMPSPLPGGHSRKMSASIRLPALTARCLPHRNISSTCRGR